MTHTVALRLMNTRFVDTTTLTMELNTTLFTIGEDIYPLVVSSVEIKGSPMRFAAHFPIHQTKQAINHHKNLIDIYRTNPSMDVMEAFKQLGCSDLEEEAIEKHKSYISIYVDDPEVWVGKVAKHFNQVFGNCAVQDYISNLDKAEQYREEWRKAGIPFNLGALLYLLTYVHPYTQEVRNAGESFVHPVQWVIDMYKKDARVKQFLAERERNMRWVVIYWRDGTNSLLEQKPGEGKADLFKRHGYGGGITNAIDFIDDNIKDTENPYTHDWVNSEWVSKESVFQN